MNIALDMMGEDFAPLEAVKGLQLYFAANSNPAFVFCLGDETRVQPLLQEYNIPADKIKLVHPGNNRLSRVSHTCIKRETKVFHRHRFLPSGIR